MMFWTPKSSFWRAKLRNYGRFAQNARQSGFGRVSWQHWTLKEKLESLLMGFDRWMGHTPYTVMTAKALKALNVDELINILN